MNVFISQPTNERIKALWWTADSIILTLTPIMGELNVKNMNTNKCSIFQNVQIRSKKNGDTYIIVGAPNKIDAMLAAIQQLHTEMHNLQEQMAEKQEAVEILTKYCCDEIGGRNKWSIK